MNQIYILLDFLRLPRPQVERRKSIYSPWGRGKKIDFQAIFNFIFIIDLSHILKKVLRTNFSLFKESVFVYLCKSNKISDDSGEK
jgi:hypothetical protein